MVIRSFLFGDDVPVDVIARDDSGTDTRVIVVAEKDFGTPCGTLFFHAGGNISFSKVSVNGNVIRPLSGVEIRRTMANSF